ncbi:HlyD family type I secretion periplasmic adaptor subunit [Yersinia intermedia]|jgi:protease secretion system membrane fusion protein|uniref:HlyD family type I secretion periplasmic adaptor subunit n=1 Tax=Yersinia intermedia TaxID=631 RepID=UPI0005E77C7F|nr:HlyD family type I secretion periplasmic adaptor subunit [Yersinia intermedia]MCB5312410.1 HlyD family type I secretion periplasmic adaptor subunit [Yersinia intermedia]MCB5326300.1 HlyD family type I secretion periplasmic adaptor subunit [Yersinia intermedia]WET16416.1 HlyD family type I secretion periplasmic adaptor subunit [Yersinia intermedia]CNB91236.1 HlyD family secretion protein [Yersinia intermedia]CQJ67165.1 HlyD family secretion protein [Yersinia intermedia]
MSEHNKKTEQAFLQEIQRSENRALYWGWGLVLAGFGGFILWALLAPLDKGVPITGTVVVSGNRKAIQHPEGGIVDHIMVHDGDRVVAGEVLLTLNAVRARSASDGLTSQYYQLLANEARLLAEQKGNKQLVETPRLQQVKRQTGMDEMLALQQLLLDSRQQALQLESDGLRANIAGLQAAMGAQKQVLGSKNSQKQALSQQLDGLKSLADENYVPRNKMLESKQLYAQLNGEIAQIIGEIKRVEREIQEQNLRIQLRQQEYRKEVNTQMAEVQSTITEVFSQLEKANFDLANIQMRSPVAGTVVEMKVFTEGGVIAAGQSLMEILPDDQPLFVDARVPVEMVDKIHSGLAVELQFTAFNQSTTPKVEGTVKLLSADRILDERTQEPYYSLRVEVSEAARQKLDHLEIKPGMPVQGFVRTGERSMINYLFKPLMDRLHIALTEE